MSLRHFNITVTNANRSFSPPCKTLPGDGALRFQSTVSEFCRDDKDVRPIFICSEANNRYDQLIYSNISENLSRPKHKHKLNKHILPIQLQTTVYLSQKKGKRQ